MTNNDGRFVTFEAQGLEHTYRLTDIQAVGIAQHNGAQSYVQAFNTPLLVGREEAIRVRAAWLEEG